MLNMSGWIKGKRKQKTALLLVLVLLVTLLSGGSGILQDLILDTGKHIIYQRCNAGDLIKVLNADPERAKTVFQDQYLSILGEMDSTLSNMDGFSMKAVGGGDGAVFCTGKNAANVSFAKGKKVYVCGKVQVLTGDNAQIQIEADAVKETDDTSTSLSEYVFADKDTVVNKKSFNKRTIGSASYYVPDRFLPVEGKIRDLDLGTAEGYQYRLCDMKRSTAGNAEMLFVFYVDMYRYVKPQDMEKTWKIEKAIVENIVPNPDIFFLEWFLPSSNNLYGTELHYYETSYHTYNLEFVFARDGDEGFLCELYMYRQKPEYLDDVLYTLRFLEP